MKLPWNQVTWAIEASWAHSKAKAATWGRFCRTVIYTSTEVPLPSCYQFKGTLRPGHMGNWGQLSSFQGQNCPLRLFLQDSYIQPSTEGALPSCYQFEDSRQPAAGTKILGGRRHIERRILEVRNTKFFIFVYHSRQNLCQLTSLCQPSSRSIVWIETHSISENRERERQSLCRQSLCQLTSLCQPSSRTGGRQSLWRLEPECIQQKMEK